MRVLHVISGLPKAAGTSVFCVELCNHLSLQGVGSCIAVRRKNEDDYAPAPSVPVLEVADDFSSLPFRPDIVHIHALWEPFLHKFAAWARRERVPLVFSPHGMLTPWALSQKRIKKCLALALYQYRDLRSSALLHATAASEVADIRRLKLTQPVVVAPLGVDLPAIDSVVKEGGRGRARTALFISRVHPKKGLFNLVDAWAVLKNRQPAIGQWRCVIAGPDQGGHTAEVMARAAAAGLAREFEFVGPVFGREKDRLYAQADLFVLPTYSENFGVVVVEALAHGCPVVTTKGAPWAELMGNSESSKVLKCESSKVRESVTANGTNQANNDNSRTLERSNSITSSGRCGWWIDIGAEPLAQALGEAISLTDEEREAMGRNGRNLVQAKYSWPIVAQEMMGSYQAVLDGKSGGSESPRTERVKVTNPAR